MMHQLTEDNTFHFNVQKEEKGILREEAASCQTLVLENILERLIIVEL